MALNGGEKTSRLSGLESTYIVVCFLGIQGIQPYSARSLPLCKGMLNFLFFGPSFLSSFSANQIYLLRDGACLLPAENYQLKRVNPLCPGLVLILDSHFVRYHDLDSLLVRVTS